MTKQNKTKQKTGCLYIPKKIDRKKYWFAFHPQYFLGVFNSSTAVSTVWVLEVDVPTTDLLLRKYTQHTKLLHRMICMTSRRASHFHLQVRDRQEARRGTCGVGCGLQYTVEYYVNSTYWERGSKRTIRDRLWQKQLAAVRRGYGTRTWSYHGSSVLLSACCLLLSVICDLRKKNKQKKYSLKNCLCGRKCSSMGWLVSKLLLFFQKVSSTYSRNLWYGGVTNDRLRNKQLAPA